MSRTKRNIPGYFSKYRSDAWNIGFLDRIRNGLVSMPMPLINKSGDYGIDEVWGQEAKKFSKRLRNRSLRRQNKKIETE